jgi:hypothetical protein
VFRRSLVQPGGGDPWTVEAESRRGTGPGSPRAEWRVDPDAVVGVADGGTRGGRSGGTVAGADGGSRAGIDSRRTPSGGRRDANGTRTVEGTTGPPPAAGR